MYHITYAWLGASNSRQDGRATEASAEQADKEKGARKYSGAALRAPEHWEHTITD